MVRTQISLFGILLLAMFLETFIVPGLWSTLRVDLLIGMTIGVIIHLSFSQGLVFVMVASLVLQPFSGARTGFIPMLYLFGFFALDLLKNVIYLENVQTQLILAVIFNVIFVEAYVVSLDMSLGQTEIWPLLAGSLLTGVLCPLMVTVVGNVKKAWYEPS